jgi:hypothetical protein
MPRCVVLFCADTEEIFLKSEETMENLEVRYSQTGNLTAAGSFYQFNNFTRTDWTGSKLRYLPVVLYYEYLRQHGGSIYLCDIIKTLREAVLQEKKIFPDFGPLLRNQIEPQAIRYRSGASWSLVEGRISTTNYRVHKIKRRVNYKAWLFQLLIWNSIVIVAKFLLFILEYLLSSFLDVMSKFLLGWIEAYPTL